ncbi:glycine betaine ABC transporter substrate-binding protein [Salibacterium halotolerans]|uniref:Glycine betaine/proline transport system substrate-binding protein n=1 Tax=Salibacterium halotolerans TaxID=1884432 RepID=A0A1I5PHG7_9BACI|nr:glycine betaine ABC transporter substrate-binding protein [Salibacterium halotolerans]SFP33558.1 glycine betaine/proline transport system substrate-binding protein [Salibacterium halotolerans]
MLKKNWKKIALAAGLSLTMLTAACGQNESGEGGSEGSGEGSGSNGSSGEESGESSGEQTESSANVGEAVDYTIVGIEPGAGVTAATNTALSEYDNLSGWEQKTSSTAAMLSELRTAYSNEEPIVIVGWNPHFKFAQWDLKYLKDPKNAYGEAEEIRTMVRTGLEEDMPGVYTILDRFKWTLEDSESFLLEAQEKDIETVAQEWVDNNQDKVDEWINGVESVDGKSVELALTPWDSERASSNVVKLALEQKGYDVTLTPVDPSIVFESLANGDVDGSTAAWMPKTHGSFYEEHKENIVDLGPNLEGALTGLAVPTYMDIESIEDLEPAE